MAPCDEERSLICQLLTYSPRRRATAAMALEHAYMATSAPAHTISGKAAAVLHQQLLAVDDMGLESLREKFGSISQSCPARAADPHRPAHQSSRSLLLNVADASYQPLPPTLRPDGSLRVAEGGLNRGGLPMLTVETGEGAEEAEDSCTSLPVTAKTPREVTDMYRQGKQRYDEGQQAEALLCFEKVHEMHPGYRGVVEKISYIKEKLVEAET